MTGKMARAKLPGGEDMSQVKGYSRPGLFGQINHYDEMGHKVGYSRPGLFGWIDHYDGK